MSALVRRLGAAAIAAAATGAPAPAILAAQEPTGAPAGATPLAAKRDVSSRGATISVDGGPPINARGFEGAAISAQVLGVMGPDGTMKKQLGPVTYEPASIDVGIDAKPLLDWVAASWSGKAPPPRSVSVSMIGADPRMTGESRELQNAVLVETTIPALDGNSKDVGYFTLTLAPSAIRTGPRGQDTKMQLGTKTKQWLASNFRFELEPLPTKRIARIESFTVRQNVASGSIGEARQYVTQAGAPVFPNLTIFISEADRAGWSEWHDDFVVKGNNGDDREKSGAIVFLGPDLKSELARITLSNCGIARLGSAPAHPMAGNRFSVELYCERMAFVPPT